MLYHFVTGKCSLIDYCKAIIQDLSTGSTQEDPSLYRWDVKNQIKQTKAMTIPSFITSTCCSSTVVSSAHCKHKCKLTPILV